MPVKLQPVDHDPFAGAWKPFAGGGDPEAAGAAQASTAMAPAVTAFMNRGLVGVAEGMDAAPEWATKATDLINNPDANAALGMAGGKFPAATRDVTKIHQSWKPMSAATEQFEQVTRNWAFLSRKELAQRIKDAKQLISDYSLPDWNRNVVDSMERAYKAKVEPQPARKKWAEDVAPADRDPFEGMR